MAPRASFRFNRRPFALRPLGKGSPTTNNRLVQAGKDRREGLSSLALSPSFPLTLGDFRTELNLR